RVFPLVVDFVSSVSLAFRSAGVAAPGRSATVESNGVLLDRRRSHFDPEPPLRVRGPDIQPRSTRGVRLLNYLVRPRQHRLRYRDTERIGGLEVDETRTWRTARRAGRRA